MENILNSLTLTVSTPTELAGIATNQFGNGQPAIVTAMLPGSGPGLYRLQVAISSNPDHFFVVPTFDDPLRQWVSYQIQEQSVLPVISSELDLTVAPQAIVMVPPIPYRNMVSIGLTWQVTQVNGTIAAGPTAQAGTDAAATSLVPSGVQTGVAAAAQGTAAGMTGAVAANLNQDMTQNGIVVKITNGATLGTATLFKARISMVSSLARF